MGLLAYTNVPALNDDLPVNVNCCAMCVWMVQMDFSIKGVGPGWVQSKCQLGGFFRSDY
jgi:hypothetical protein